MRNRLISIYLFLWVNITPCPDIPASEIAGNTNEVSCHLKRAFMAGSRVFRVEPGTLPGYESSDTGK